MPNNESLSKTRLRGNSEQKQDSATTATQKPTPSFRSGSFCVYLVLELQNGMTKRIFQDPTGRSAFETNTRCKSVTQPVPLAASHRNVCDDGHHPRAGVSCRATDEAGGFALRMEWTPLHTNLHHRRCF